MSDHSQESHPQDNNQDHNDQPQEIESTLDDQQSALDWDEEENEEEFSGEDFYDSEADLEYFHNQKLHIEESWLEWERQTSVNNRQSASTHNFSIFQKPGSAKRRERRKRAAIAQTNSQQTSRPSSAGSNTASGSGSGGGGGGDESNANVAAVERLKRLGSYRPALASSIVHSYSNLTWEATQAAREKRLAAKGAPNGSGQNIICTIPVELLSHIVSHLEPSDLSNVSLVCQLFYHVVNADSCWKAAFMKFFGVSIPFKRLDPKSWRGEYIKRTRLLRRWEKGRGSNVMINPGIGQITKLWAEVDGISAEGSLLASSLGEGVVAKLDPEKGKVQRDAVFRMIHFEHVEVITMAMDRRRVLWGLSTGQVSLTTMSYGTAGQIFQTFAGFHLGPVSCVKLVPGYMDFVLTGGVDGVVKLWDVAKSRCVYEFWTGSSLSENSRARITHICCEPGSHVIAGTSRGDVYVWNVNINSIMNPAPAPALSDNAGSAPEALVEVIPSHSSPKSVSISEGFKGVGYLEVDFGLSTSGLILTHATDSAVMNLYNLETLTHVATLKSPAHFTPITAIHWDVPKREKPMISLSNGSRLDSGNTLHGRHDHPSLLASGDSTGNICIWYLSDALKRHVLKETHQAKSHLLHEVIDLQPTCVLKAHVAPVTSLFMDKLIIVSGSKDGWVKTWNPVNGKLVSVLNNGYIRGRDANNPINSAINSIVVNSQKSRGAFSMGGIVRCWDFSPEAAKDKHRKHQVKKPVHYSGGPKNKIHLDIRHSVEETVSLHRLEAQTKERREQIHRRYNNLEGLNMADMTDEEIVEYVMMLSKDQDDQDSSQIALEMQQIQEMEEELARGKQAISGSSNGGEGSSTAPSRFRSLQDDDERPTEQELEEEEELVRRAIALSMLDAELPSSDNHQSHLHENCEQEDLPRTHEYQPHSWEPSQIVEVDAVGGESMNQEDREIVNSILRDLEDEDDENVKSKNISEPWPTLGNSSTEVATTTTSGVTSPQPPPPLQQTIISQSTGGSSANGNNSQEESSSKKMTWSMIARTNSETSISSGLGGQKHGQDSQQQGNRQPVIIRQYPRSASQEEIEDEDTLLARILSLSMVEK